MIDRMLAWIFSHICKCGAGISKPNAFITLQTLSLIIITIFCIFPYSKKMFDTVSHRKPNKKLCVVFHMYRSGVWRANKVFTVAMSVCFQIETDRQVEIHLQSLF